MHNYNMIQILLNKNQHNGVQNKAVLTKTTDFSMSGTTMGIKPCKKKRENLKQSIKFTQHLRSIYIYIYIHTILPKVLGRPLLMNRFDYFSHFYEYKS